MDSASAFYLYTMNLLTEIHVSYKPTILSHKNITNSTEAYETVLKHWNKHTIELYEEVKVMYFNGANKLLGIHDLSKGGISSTIIDIRRVLSVALKCNASGFILVHNHPSGRLSPSKADKDITDRMDTCAKQMDIELLDHLIITRDGYYSFSDEGIL